MIASVCLVHTGWAKNWTILKSLQLLYVIMQKSVPYIKMQFFILSKTGILNHTTFKYSLHKCIETTLH